MKLINAAAARLLLSVAYPLLAHAASETGDARFAALALLDILLIVLVLPLVGGRVWAWALVALSAALLWQVQASTLLPVLLLLPPVLFTGFLSWGFARTLAPGSVPLIARIVSGMERCDPDELAPPLQRYTRRLTLLWALLLGGMALANALLGTFAVPDGLLVRMGYAPALQVPQVVWSWIANLLDYGVVGLVFVVEYAVRTRLFPDRPYRTLPEFFQRLGALGPAFWRDVAR